MFWCRYLLGMIGKTTDNYYYYVCTQRHTPHVRVTKINCVQHTRDMIKSHWVNLITNYFSFCERVWDIILCYSEGYVSCLLVSLVRRWIPFIKNALILIYFSIMRVIHKGNSFPETFLTQNPFKIITRLKLSTELRRGDDLHFNMIAIFDVVVGVVVPFLFKNILNPTIMPHWHVSTVIPPISITLAIYYSYLYQRLSIASHDTHTRYHKTYFN